MTQSFKTNSQAETERLGARMAGTLRGGEIIAFRGGLGAGKTAFSRGLLRGLGYTGEVPSPTFAIVNEYRGGRLDAAHFDVYRLAGEEELYGTGFYDYLDGRTVVLIEWSETVAAALDGEPCIVVEIDGCADEPRAIAITGAEKLP